MNNYIARPPLWYFLLSLPQKMTMPRACGGAIILHFLMLAMMVLVLKDKQETKPLEFVAIQLGYEEKVAEPSAANPVSNWNYSKKMPKAQPRQQQPVAMPQLKPQSMTQPNKVAKTVEKEMLKISSTPLSMQAPSQAVSVMDRGEENAAAQDDLNQIVMSDLAAALSGSTLGNRDRAVHTTVKDYAEMLSLWIEKHQPNIVVREAGRGVVGILVHQTGHVLRAELVRSTGVTALDQRILAMVWASNPMPPLPGDWGSSQEYFKVPFSFNYR